MTDHEHAFEPGDEDSYLRVVVTKSGPPKPGDQIYHQPVEWCSCGVARKVGEKVPAGVVTDMEGVCPECAQAAANGGTHVH